MKNNGESKALKLYALFTAMLKVGLFTFGGGYAMIALLENEFTEKRSWISKDEFLDMTAVAGSAPGSIAINSSTYIGYKIAGVSGSVIATVAVCIPSFAIIYVISLFFNAFLSFEMVQFAFKGIQVCVIYLIFTAGFKMLKTVEKDIFTYIVFFTTLSVMLFMSVFAVNLSTAVYILISGAVGVFVNFLKKIVSDRKGEDK